jgi:hypothetical protein
VTAIYKHAAIRKTFCTLLRGGETTYTSDDLGAKRFSYRMTWGQNDLGRIDLGAKQLI